MAVKIMITIGLVIIFSAAFLFLGPLPGNKALIKTGFNQVAGPSCPDGALLSVSPVDLNDFISITPLGNLSPPDHTIPTDHIYVVMKQDNKIDPSKDKTVRAPGDITIERISHNTANKQGAVFSNDYAIDFRPCKDVRLNFDHVTTISDELQAAFEQEKPSCETKIPRPGDEYQYCKANLNYKMKAGDLIGTAGGGTSTGLDIQAVDGHWLC